MLNGLRSPAEQAEEITPGMQNLVAMKPRVAWDQNLYFITDNREAEECSMELWFEVRLVILKLLWGRQLKTSTNTWEN